MEMLGSEQGDESDYETSLAHTAGASGGGFVFVLFYRLVIKCSL